MTVKWDMQQKHGSPPRVMRGKGSDSEWSVMTPVHFTALSMVDISYSVDAKHHCRHAAWNRTKWEERAVKHEVGGTAAQNNLYAPWQDGDVCKGLSNAERWGGQLRVAGNECNNQPWWDIASLLHEGPEGEPQAIKNPKVVWRVWGALRVFGLIVLIQVPFIRAEPADEEQHHTHADIGKNYTHPNLIGQRVQEGKHTRLGLLGLLNHNGDAQAHKGLREVYHLFPYQRNC